MRIYPLPVCWLARTRNPCKSGITHALRRTQLGCGQLVARVAPPLNIERPLVNEALEIFEEALTEAEKTLKITLTAGDALIVWR